MILDALLQFSNNQSLVQPVGAYDSTNIIDFGINSGIPNSANGGGARDMGIGDDPAMKLVVQVGTGFTSGGAATLQVLIQGASDNGAGAPGTFTPWYQSSAEAVANLNAGSRLFQMDLPRPPDGAPIPRFVKLTYNIGGAAITAGTVNSYLVLDRNDQPYAGIDNSVMGGYPAGININD